MNTKSKPCKYASYVRTTKGKGKCKDTQLKAPFMKTGTLGLVFQKGVGGGSGLYEDEGFANCGKGL